MKALWVFISITINACGANDNNDEPSAEKPNLAGALPSPSAEPTPTPSNTNSSAQDAQNHFQYLTNLFMGIQQGETMATMAPEARQALLEEGKCVDKEYDDGTTGSWCYINDVTCTQPLFPDTPTARNPDTDCQRFMVWFDESGLVTSVVYPSSP